MIKMKVIEDKSMFLLNIGGYVTKENVEAFVVEYKETIKSVKVSNYSLVIDPSEFKTNSEEHIKNSFRMFMKTGFKNMYVVDKYSMMDNINLSKIEKKFFFSRVKVVKSINEI